MLDCGTDGTCSFVCLSNNDHCFYIRFDFGCSVHCFAFRPEVSCFFIAQRHHPEPSLPYSRGRLGLLLDDSCRSWLVGCALACLVPIA